MAMLAGSFECLCQGRPFIQGVPQNCIPFVFVLFLTSYAYKVKMMSFLDTTFNGDLKNGPNFIRSTIFDENIVKNVKALYY